MTKNFIDDTMDEDEIKIGVVTRFSIGKNYGFIQEMGTNESYFFFYDKEERANSKKNADYPLSFIRNGDFMRFRIKQSKKNPEDIMACDFSFIGNPDVKLISSSIQEGFQRFGVVHVINNGCYITDTEIDITFPLKIANSKIPNTNFELLKEKPTLEYFLELKKNPTTIYARLKIHEEK